MKQLTKYQLKQYGMTPSDYAAMVAAAWANLPDADGDCGTYNATLLAELTAQGMEHDDWLADETHPIWDVAVDVAEQGDEARCPECGSADTEDVDDFLVGEQYSYCRNCDHEWQD